jgi:hypothetical protein
MQCKTGRLRDTSLRVDPPRNNQAKFIRFAQAYEIAKIDVY